jgi:hypothetical protein
MYGAGPAIMPGKALGEKMTDAEFNAGTLVFLDAFSTAYGVGPIFMESFHFIGVEVQIS